VVGDIDGGRVLRREVLCADDVDPGRKAIYAVSQVVTQRKDDWIKRGNIDIEVAGGRLEDVSFGGEFLCANDVDPGRAAMYAVSMSASQRDTYLRKRKRRYRCRGSSGG
jgi:hypothetical protein